MKIALFNLDTFPTHRGIINSIHQHHDVIQTVVLSDPFNGKRGGFFKQAWQNWRRSGVQFVNYMFFKIPLFSMLSFLSCRYSRKFGRGFSVKGICQYYNISCIKIGDINSTEVKEHLEKHSIDLICIYYFDQILQQQLIDLPKHGVVNFHPADLPQCRGLFPIFFAHNYKKENLGITAHWVENKEIDNGGIINKVIIPSPTGSTSLLSLDKYVSDHFPVIFSDTIYQLEHLEIHQQEESLSSYYSFPNRADIAKWNQQKHSFVSLKVYFKGLIER